MLDFRPVNSLILVLALMIMVSCATVIMPNGGAKDVSPPKVIGTYPMDKSVGFKDNHVLLLFDEFIELVNPTRSIQISPQISEGLKLSLSGKKAKLALPDNLLPNTTYSIKFTNAFRDYNEGNLMPNFQLNFSTGPFLDSGRYKLQIISKKNQVSNETVVALVSKRHEFFSNKLKYVARLENEHAIFDNLNGENYFAFAFVDSNLNMKWDKNEKVGFLKQPIDAQQQSSSIEVFQNARDKIDFQVEVISPNEYVINASQDIYDVKIQEKDVKLYPLSFNSFKVIVSPRLVDQKLTLVYNNSKKEVVSLPNSQNPKSIELLVLNQNSRAFDSISPDTVNIEFNSFITAIDFKKVKLKRDTTNVINPISFCENKVIITGLDFNKNYTILIDSNTIFQEATRNRKPIIYSFNTGKKETVINELTLELDSSIMKKNVIVYQVSNGKIVRLEKKPKIIYKNVYDKSITYHIFQDINLNNTWDTGSVEMERLPEPYFIETIVLESKRSDYVLKLKSK